MKLTGGGGAATEQNLTQSSVGSKRDKLGQAKVFRSSVHPDDWEHLQFEFWNKI